MPVVAAAACAAAVLFAVAAAARAPWQKSVLLVLWLVLRSLYLSLITDVCASAVVLALAAAKYIAIIVFVITFATRGTAVASANAAADCRSSMLAATVVCG